MGVCNDSPQCPSARLPRHQAEPASNGTVGAHVATHDAVGGAGEPPVRHQRHVLPQATADRHRAALHAAHHMVTAFGEGGRGGITNRPSTQMGCTEIPPGKSIASESWIPDSPAQELSALRCSGPIKYHIASLPGTCTIHMYAEMAPGPQVRGSPARAAEGDSCSGMPGAPRGPSYRMTSTVPFATRPSITARKQACSLSKHIAGPRNGASCWPLSLRTALSGARFRAGRCGQALKPRIRAHTRTHTHKINSEESGETGRFGIPFKVFVPLVVLDSQASS